MHDSTQVESGLQPSWLCGEESLSPSKDTILREARLEEEILRRRAVDYATPLVTDVSSEGNESDTLLVKIGADTYGISCSEIEEVVPLHNLVSLPNTPAGIIGISSNRGVLFAVLDPRVQLRIPGTNITTMHRIVILRHSAHDIGVLVDAIVGMAGIDTGTLLTLPPHIDNGLRRFVSGLTADKVLMLDVGALLNDVAAHAPV
jgi:purine-binding chemotaxis protein CheW